ncbi:MAG TPA: hypothetical protein ENH02_04090 [Bacteroidetes bacterium]|nr:hypothetical protein [Bacteroidota bacterium]
MSESITISKKTPESKSLDYNFLREEGVKYIQKLAGKIWTDYNIHDPGVTTLEVLCYAITELGYRANYPVQDLLTTDPADPNAPDIRNFYTAREILPNAPVTINDYRKLLIDVDIEDPSNTGCNHVGVKNAWIDQSKSNEIPVYVHKQDSKLDYKKDPSYIPASDETSQPPLEIGILYDILLEFEKCDAYGDLNENSITKALVIDEHLPDINLNGLKIKITVEFPRWDNEDTDREDILSIKANVQKIKLNFSNVPNGYDFSYELVNNIVKLTGTITSASDIVNIPGLTEIETKVNNFIYYDNVESLRVFYLQKVGKTEEIIKEVKARLHANRNLCEDFYKLSALKVEKIAVCTDVEIEQEADVEQVQAEIFHEIGRFLSPAVNFYTLDEMLDKCKVLHEFSMLEIDKKNKSFTVKGDLEEKLLPGNTITISASRSNNGDYSVKSVTVDSDAGQTKIFVTEDITSDLLTEGEILSFYITGEDTCLTADQIFEGPVPDHGFIDNEELEKADRRKVIHVSDLIQIIMDIPGVTAVKSIQIANIPQDNEDGAIASKSVKWCMQLAFDRNYVPRLSMLDSKITFYKEQLPFRASASEVESIIDDLEKQERPAKLFNPVLDFKIPDGTYRNLESYQSIQNEFPLTYGIGEEGFPTMGNDKNANTLRAAQARQFKGYLMMFDQLLANYFSQLAHVKDLFSMNTEKDEFGNYLIGRTYYTQPLFDIVPNADALYLDKNGHEVTLDNIAEDEALFNTRKNKFLDHLIGRFAEKFTDYALLTIKLSGEQSGPVELIEDKLAFLNAYPRISSARGKGFNHQESCKIWHSDNISGLRRRVSFLTGINETTINDLQFGSNFSIVAVGDGFQINVFDNTSALLLKSYEIYDEEEAVLELEKMIINGVNADNYQVLSEDGMNFYFTLDCGLEEVLGISERENYTDNLPDGEAAQAIDELVKLFRAEFFNNFESNRNNLACPLLNYLDYSIMVNMEPDPPVAIVSYNLYSDPLTFDVTDLLLSGQYSVAGAARSEAVIISVNTGIGQIVIDGNIASRLNADDLLVINGSQDNDGTYTVVSATDAGGNTEIIVSETVPSNNTPLGEVKYNNDSAAEMQNKANEKLYDILWQLIDKASRKGNYSFSSGSGAYRFRITGNYGEAIAESTESDFNDPLAVEISNLPSGKIHITNSSGNDGNYTVTGAVADGADVRVIVSQALPSSTADGNLNINESFSFQSDGNANTFKVATDLTGILFAGDTITVSGSKSMDGDYTVYSLDYDGPDTNIVVEETIPATDSTGELSYCKSFKITVVNGDKISFKGGYDDKTVELFIEFIKGKFFSHEGFHVVEHVLLRPKVRGMHFTDATAETLTEGLADNGSLYFNKTLPVFSASSATRIFRVEGNISSEIDNDPSTDIASEIYVSGTGANDGYYLVKGVQFDSGNNRAIIHTKEQFPVDIPFSNPVGDISYMIGTPITAVSAAGLSITVAEPKSLEIFTGEVVEIRGSSEGVNDGSYKVERVIALGTQQKVVISRAESEVEDKLLSIVLDEDDCDACQIQDPYTCIASVILPHWQGRFDNMDFRHFFERQLRMEAPAHVFLNICWISCGQMNEFEEKYKAWLVENARRIKDYGKLSATQNALVDILNKLRNVYPSGILHDCAEDETLENAIILDNSVLGNA